MRSRAYAKFKSVEALADFHKAFNGHIFTDSKGILSDTMLTTGRSSRVVIEFAPFQKYVKGKTKPDARQGTIEDSPEYKEFLASLNQPVPAESHVSNAEDGPKTTPLIEYIRTQKAARAEKDKINKEKLRLARVAATQAKANAQTAKLRAERMQKAETGGKPVENGKDARRPAAKSGAPRPKDQRPKGQAQPPKNMEKIAEAPVAEGSGTPVARMQMRNAPAHKPDTPIDANGSGAFRGRGRGARGGRARPHGVYKPGSGRGGRRGGGVNEASSSGTVGNG